MAERGIYAQWPQASLALRALSHVAMAAEGATNTSGWARTALLSASLVGDAWHTNAVRDPARNRIPERILNGFDACAWAAIADTEPSSIRSATIATAVPALLEIGVRLGVGVASEPILKPDLPWSPVWKPRTGPLPIPDWTRLGQFVGYVAREATLPYAGLAIGRRLRKRRLGWGPFGWGALALAGGYAIGRTRARAHDHTRAVWKDRTLHLIEDARIRSRIQSALHHNVAEVDPKGMLAFLERVGSVRAGAVLDEASSAPQRALHGMSERGKTLAATVDLRAVSPDTQRIRWLPQSQVQFIRNEIARIDDDCLATSSTTSDAEISVISADPHSIVLEYRGVQICSRVPTPELVIRLEPTVPALMISSCWTLLTITPALGAAPVAAVLPAVALQWAAVRHLTSTSAFERRGDRRSAFLLAASSLLVNLAVGFRRHNEEPSGPLAFAGTGATQPLMLLLGGSWSDLPKERRALLMVALGGWLFALGRMPTKSWRTALLEAVYLLMPAAASARITVHTRREAELLDESLHQVLVSEIDAVARSQAREQLDEYVQQLTTVIDELPNLHPGLSNTEAEQIVATFRTERQRLTGSDPLALIDW